MEEQQDMVCKQDGTMWVLRYGEWSPMEDMVIHLKDGSRVSMDGTITQPNGSSRMLMDGEGVTFDGEPTTLVDMKTDPNIGAE